MVTISPRLTEPPRRRRPSGASARSRNSSDWRASRSPNPCSTCSGGPRTCSCSGTRHVPTPSSWRSRSLSSPPSSCGPWSRWSGSPGPRPGCPSTGLWCSDSSSSWGWSPVSACSTPEGRFWCWSAPAGRREPPSSSTCARRLPERWWPCAAWRGPLRRGLPPRQPRGRRHLRPGDRGRRHRGRARAPLDRVPAVRRVAPTFVDRRRGPDRSPAVPEPRGLSRGRHVVPQRDDGLDGDEHGGARHPDRAAPDPLDGAGGQPVPRKPLHPARWSLRPGRDRDRHPGLSGQPVRRRPGRPPGPGAGADAGGIDSSRQRPR